MRIAIGVPVLDSVPGESFPHLVKTSIEASKHGEVCFFSPLNLVPHDRARIDVIEGAMEAECDLLYFVDDDTIVPMGGFTKLLRTLRENNAQVVSGHYYQRGMPYLGVWSLEINGEWKRVDAASGVHEIGASGLGCALIDLRWVKKNLKPPFFEMGHDGRATMVIDDLSFYDKVRIAGGKILGDADVRCGHVGARAVVCDQTASWMRAQALKAGYDPSNDLFVYGRNKQGKE